MLRERRNNRSTDNLYRKASPLRQQIYKGTSTHLPSLCPFGHQPQFSPLILHQIEVEGIFQSPTFSHHLLAALSFLLRFPPDYCFLQLNRHQSTLVLSIHFLLLAADGG